MLRLQTLVIAHIKIVLNFVYTCVDAAANVEDLFGDADDISSESDNEAKKSGEEAEKGEDDEKVITCCTVIPLLFEYNF